MVTLEEDPANPPNLDRPPTPGIRSRVGRIVWRCVRTLLHGLVGALIMVVAGFIFYVQRMPDPKVWHTAQLGAEYTINSPVATWDDYLALESRLFAQLDEKVCAKVETKDQYQINRFFRGSLADPQRWPTNWNRTFEFPTDAPKAGVLLLHGLSDSPYSLRHLGQRLHEQGAWVVGLRVPGHGTAPSGLVHVRWEDMAGAVTLAVRHLRDACDDRPLYIVGYSNGGALGVLYSLSTLEDSSLPTVQGLVLISPEIGVTKLAALAPWQGRLGKLPGLHKLAWSGIGIEFDPFKYNSFPINAGEQAYRLTSEIQGRFDRLAPSGVLTRFPPVIAFQSAADATVSAPALVRNFFARLPPSDNELVVFDINRFHGLAPLLKTEARDELAALLKATDRNFVLTGVTNKDFDSRTVEFRCWRHGAEHAEVTASDLAWPADAYSLSHIALCFAEDDPLYGDANGGPSPGIQLGSIALRGERGVLRVSPGDLLRLRYNPFYSYLEQRVLEFMQLDASAQLGMTSGTGMPTPLPASPEALLDAGA